MSNLIPGPDTCLGEPVNLAQNPTIILEPIYQHIESKINPRCIDNNDNNIYLDNFDRDLPNDIPNDIADAMLTTANSMILKPGVVRESLDSLKLLESLESLESLKLLESLESRESLKFKELTESRDSHVSRGILGVASRSNILASHSPSGRGNIFTRLVNPIGRIANVAKTQLHQGGVIVSGLFSGTPNLVKSTVSWAEPMVSRAEPMVSQIIPNCKKIASDSASIHESQMDDISFDDISINDAKISITHNNRNQITGVVCAHKPMEFTQITHAGYSPKIAMIPSRCQDTHIIHNTGLTDDQTKSINCQIDSKVSHIMNNESLNYQAHWIGAIETPVIDMSHQYPVPNHRGTLPDPNTGGSKKIENDMRRVSKWVEDSSVAKCFNCNTSFTMVLRRHHCRLCGRVFCSYCSNYFTKLPLDILSKVPDKPHCVTDVIWGENLNENVRVCKNCFSHSSKLIRIRKLIKVFELCQFTIRDLVFLSKFSQDWKDASKFLLSKFREIQYKLSIEELSPSEKHMLWINRKFLTGHSRWIVQLVKVIDFQDMNSVFILEQLMQRHKKNICWDIMCTRFCSDTVGITDMLDLIQYNDNNQLISRFIIKCLDDITPDILINYLPFMVYNFGNNNFILDILLKISIGNSNLDGKHFKFVSHLYWSVKVYCVNSKIRKKSIISILTAIRNNSTQDFRHRFKEMIIMDKLDIKQLQCLNKKKRIVLPICTDKTFVGVDSKNIEIMSSYSQPVIVNFIDEKGVQKPIMFKNDDVRKDYIVLGIINIIHDILKKEEIDMDIDIVRYEVIPTSNCTGYIEIVENASTVFSIVEDSGLTIQNYILNHNKNQIISKFREKFIKSTALYCVVSYLLGIGDRHLDNIMISKDGLLFHIDFGYILGQDPKYSNNRFIRVTPEIINVIGGYGTDDYDYFKKTCVKIYNRLRLHVNLFSNLLSIVPAIDPSITMDTLKRELTERFEIGENCIEAATHMDTKVDNKNNFEYMVTDLLHRSAKSKLVKGLTYMSKSIYDVFRGR